MTPIIIDTDPGIDDAFAIIYASLHPELELLGLTTVFGNVSVEHSTDNAAFLRAMLAAKFDIAKGIGQAITKQHGGYPDFVHGKKGFGEYQFEVPSYLLHSLDAADYIIAQSHQYAGELVLAPIGPLTNIAEALRRDPTLVSRIKQVVLMGGAARVPGNVSPCAEANIWGDPHAAAAVFEAAWPVVMIGLDITHEVVMSDAHIAACSNTSVNGQFIRKISDFYGAFYKAERELDGFAVHDPTALIYITQPQYFSTELGMVQVPTEGPANGATLFAAANNSYPEPYWRRPANCKLCFDVDHDAVLGELMHYIKQFCGVQ